MSESDKSAAGQLIDLSVRAFVDAVASVHPPVPAGGSVAAVSGAASAALLALVCGVLQHRHASNYEDQLRQLGDLRERLLALVDEDAVAFHAYLHARRQSSPLDEPIQRLTRTPLDIGWACAEIVDLSHSLEHHDVRHMHGDVLAARHLAQAGVRTALDIAQDNIPLQLSEDARQKLSDELSRLRARL